MKCPICENDFSILYENEWVQLLNCSNCNVVYINNKLQSSYCYKNYILPATVTKIDEFQEEKIKKINFALKTSFNPITYMKAEQIIQSYYDKALEALVNRNNTEKATIKQIDYIKHIAEKLFIYVDYNNLTLGDAKKFISFYKPYYKNLSLNSLTELYNFNNIHYCILFDSISTNDDKKNVFIQRLEYILSILIPDVKTIDDIKYYMYIVNLSFNDDTFIKKNFFIFFLNEQKFDLLDEKKYNDFLLLLKDEKRKLALSNIISTIIKDCNSINALSKE